MKPIIGLISYMVILGAMAGSYNDGTRTWRYIKPGDDSQAREGITITGVEPTAGDWAVPSSIESWPVVELKYMLAAGVTDISSVVLPSSVVTIGNKAFQGCTGLESVEVIGAVRGFGSEAFAECTALTNVVLSGGIGALGASAFRGCTSLKELRLQEGMRELGEYAFYGCSRLEKVVLPTSLTQISTGCFGDCAVIKDLTVVPAIERVSTYFYSSSASISNITFAGTWSSIPSSYCSSCANLQSVVLPAGVSEIGSQAFKTCPLSAGVVLPSGVQYVRSYAFSQSGLPKIVIPAGILAIEQYAFSECANLLTVEFLGDAPSTCGTGIYSSTPIRLTTTVPAGSVGWTSAVSTDLPETWNDRAIRNTGGESPDPPSGTVVTNFVYMTVTNVVVHYVQEVEKVPAVEPLPTDGLVAIVTEVLGSSAVPVPCSWTNRYPRYAETYGADFVKSLTKVSGKVASDGSPMFVWQDYVAGTDPTNPASRFTATLEIVNGHVVINYSPKSDDDLRVYTVWGKKHLADTTWDVVDEWHYDDYNFFKVTVEIITTEPGGYQWQTR